MVCCCGLLWGKCSCHKGRGLVAFYCLCVAVWSTQASSGLAGPESSLILPYMLYIKSTGSFTFYLGRYGISIFTRHARWADNNTLNGTQEEWDWLSRSERVRHYDINSYRLPWLGACWPALRLERRPSLHRMFWKEMRAAEWGSRGRYRGKICVISHWLLDREEYKNKVSLFNWI